MATTRLGLHGPAAAYLGFQAKAAEVVLSPTAHYIIEVRADVGVIEVRPDKGTVET